MKKVVRNHPGANRALFSDLTIVLITIELKRRRRRGWAGLGYWWYYCGSIALVGVGVISLKRTRKLFFSWGDIDV